MQTGLAGKTVLITEATRNLGRAAALAFAAEGANLALSSGSTGGPEGGESLEQVARDAAQLGVKTLTAVCDTGDEEQVRDLAQKALSEFGSVDVLVNNALLPVDSAPLGEITFETWKRKINVELRGAMVVCQAVIPSMVERNWGRVINFAGLSAFQGQDAISSTAELGIVGLTRGLAREFGPYNITANCICPGGVDPSAGAEPLAYPPEDADPIPRWGRGEEVGFLAVSLASEDAGYLTGQCLLPNGGKYFL